MYIPTLEFFYRNNGMNFRWNHWSVFTCSGVDTYILTSAWNHWTWSVFTRFGVDTYILTSAWNHWSVFTRFGVNTYILTSAFFCIMAWISGEIIGACLPVLGLTHLYTSSITSVTMVINLLEQRKLNKFICCNHVAQCQIKSGRTMNQNSTTFSWNRKR